MHIDEDKRFDKRNLMMNIKNGVITQKEYEIWVSKLPDASDKVFNPEETSPDSGETELGKDSEISFRKKVAKKKTKVKGK
jgi:hypothetical protein